MPVYEGSLDKILGVVHAKDLLTLLEHRDLIVMQDIVRARILCAGNHTDLTAHGASFNAAKSNLPLSLMSLVVQPA